MGRGYVNNHLRSGGSGFAGAILMSNLETKRVCLEKKLFGLPSCMSQFMMQIKAGMLLFLFEHEERKLYGVFEATSDGAMNIVPNAYHPLGCFPAQVLFKRIWMCKALHEDEFSCAIKDNYFAPKKFRFGLSRNQVMKLVELFSSKRINITEYQRPGIPNKIISEFEKSVRFTPHGGSVKRHSGEYSRYDGRSSQRHLDMTGSDTQSAMSAQNLTREQSSSVDDGDRSCQKALHASEAQPPHLSGHESKQPKVTRSTSGDDSSTTGRFSGHSVYGRSKDRILLLPGMPTAKGTKALSSAHQSSSHSYLKASRHEVEPGGQCGGDFRHHNYIPLPGANCFTKDAGRSFSISFQEDLSLDHSSKYLEDGDSQEARPYPTIYMDEECYPTIVKSKLRADTEQTRTSVFSRLSRASNTSRSSRTLDTGRSSKIPGTFHLSSSPEKPRLFKDQRAFQRYEAWEPVTSLSPDHLPRILSQGTEPEMTEERRRSSIPDDDESLKSKVSNVMKPSNVTFAMELEGTNDFVIEDMIAEDATVEADSEHLSLTSKRRGDFQSLYGENAMKIYAESHLDEEISLKNKRLRLKGPSFTEEQCHHVGYSSQQTTVKAETENNGGNIGNGEEIRVKRKTENNGKNIADGEEIGVRGETEYNAKNIANGEKIGVKGETGNNGANIANSEEIRVKGTNGDNKGNIANSGLSSPDHLDMHHKNKLASETSLCAASDKMDKNCEGLDDKIDAENKDSSTSQTGLGDNASDRAANSSKISTIRKKEVSNKNLKWFLQKSVDGHTKVSNGNHVSNDKR